MIYRKIEIFEDEVIFEGMMSKPCYPSIVLGEGNVQFKAMSFLNNEDLVTSIGFKNMSRSYSSDIPLEHTGETPINASNIKTLVETSDACLIFASSESFYKFVDYINDVAKQQKEIDNNHDRNID